MQAAWGASLLVPVAPSRAAGRSQLCKNKKAAAFGTYGWSGEGPKVLARLLTEAGFAVMDSELKGLWSPEEKACQEFGRRFSEFSK